MSTIDLLISRIRDLAYDGQPKDIAIKTVLKDTRFFSGLLAGEPHSFPALKGTGITPSLHFRIYHHLTRGQAEWDSRVTKKESKILLLGYSNASALIATAIDSILNDPSFSRRLPNAGPQTPVVHKPSTKRKRGRPVKNDEIVKALHRWNIKTGEDLSIKKNLKNLRSAFAILDGKVDIPGYPGDKDWLALLNDPDRELAFKGTKENLRKILGRVRQKSAS